MRAQVRYWGLWDDAGASTTYYYNWRRGDLKDHYVQSVRIEKARREGLPQGFKPQRVAN